DGTYYTVENARIYTLPEELPPIVVAAAGPSAATLAGEAGDGLWTVAPEAELIETYQQAGGSGPRYGQVTVCWAANEDEAKKTAHQYWPNAGIVGELSQELALPRHFEQAAQLVTPDDLGEKLPLGPDPERHVETIKAFVDAGTTTSTSIRSGPTRRGSSTSGNGSWPPASDQPPELRPLTMSSSMLSKRSCSGRKSSAGGRPDPTRASMASWACRSSSSRE
ncbi:MAG: LLM class flavin-dependent oxidoreductase, partial [Actinomycetota bacterium]|nr:LLM class flavin-dependent oxidoreductase [Actinomycetota bacterium]